jgi:uncharacterized membrane protein YccC
MSRENITMRAEGLMKKWNITEDHLLACRFSINVGIACVIVWYTLRFISDTNPIWAIASMVAASDPQPGEAKKMFRARLANVIVGCVVGLLFLTIGGAREWLLPIVLATTVLISSLLIKIKVMWRQAPITAAVVIASSILQGSTHAGIHQGLHKVAEVIFGSLVGMVVSVAMSKIWIVKIQPKASPFAPAKPVKLPGNQ